MAPSFARTHWIVACILACAPALGQSPTAAAPAPAFDLADVRVSPPSANMFPFSRSGFRVGKYEMHSGTMVDLIRAAYGVDPDKVLGGPSWLESDRFNVIAKTAPATPYASAMSMLQALLADRFQLAIHKDTRPMAAYALTLGKRKLQLKEPDRSTWSGCRSQPFRPPAPGAVMPPQPVECHNVTMSAFAEQIRRMAGQYLDKPVVDKTGVEGSWDLTIAWTARGQLGLAGSDGISVFDALEKIGLKLEPDTMPLPVIVVDRVNRAPTPNAVDIAKVLGETPPPTEFEVADIKPSEPGSKNSMFQDHPGGRLDVKNMTLKFLIQIAWDTLPDLVVGGPKWIDSDHFDIVAKASTGDSPAQYYQDFDTTRIMLRALLKERFKLTTHEETQTAGVYALLAPKRPPKFKKADEGSRTFCKSSPGAILGNPALTNSYTCQNTTLADFARILRQLAGAYIDHPVIDSTELTGGWDFVLSWTGRGAFDRARGGRGEPGSSPNVPSASDPNGAVSLFEALEKLGLKLELQKHPTQVLVIDHVERPSDN
jgi:uncharacterized protein (TIGR03435 family)